MSIFSDASRAREMESGLGDPTTDALSMWTTNAWDSFMRTFYSGVLIGKRNKRGDYIWTKPKCDIKIKELFSEDYAAHVQSVYAKSFAYSGEAIIDYTIPPYSKQILNITVGPRATSTRYLVNNVSGKEAKKRGVIQPYARIDYNNSVPGGGWVDYSERKYFDHRTQREEVYERLEWGYVDTGLDVTLGIKSWGRFFYPEEFYVALRKASKAVLRETREMSTLQNIYQNARGEFKRMICDWVGRGVSRGGRVTAKPSDFYNRYFNEKKFAEKKAAQIREEAKQHSLHPLQYFFGFGPTMTDLGKLVALQQTGIRTLRGIEPKDRRFKVIKGAPLDWRSILSFGSAAARAGPNKMDLDEKTQYNGSVKATIFYKIKDNDKMGKDKADLYERGLLEAAGILPTLSNLWSLVPFYWVVDSIMDVTTYLMSYDEEFMSLKTEVLGCVCSYKIVGTVEYNTQISAHPFFPERVTAHTKVDGPYVNKFSVFVRTPMLGNFGSMGSVYRVSRHNSAAITMPSNTMLGLMTLCFVPALKITR